MDTMPRRLMQAVPAFAVASVVGFYSWVPARAAWPPDNAAAATLELTPECDGGCLAGDHDERVEPLRTDGRYFEPGSVARRSLVAPGTAGEPLTITGYAVTPTGEPVAGALLDFWHDDGRGGLLRGHQYTDANGGFMLTTVVPAGGTGRARHIHVRAQAPGGAILTTRLYLADAAGARVPGALRLDPAGPAAATFTFVLRPSPPPDRKRYNV